MELVKTIREEVEKNIQTQYFKIEMEIRISIPYWNWQVVENGIGARLRYVASTGVLRAFT